MNKVIKSKQNHLELEQLRNFESKVLPTRYK